MLDDLVPPRFAKCSPEMWPKCLEQLLVRARNMKQALGMLLQLYPAVAWGCCSCLRYCACPPGNTEDQTLGTVEQPVQQPAAFAQLRS